MEKKIVLTAAVLGMIAIVLGAFASHGLKKYLQPEQLQSFEIGVRYQMYHALFLLFIATTSLLNNAQKNHIFNLCLWGILLFSGSIFMLSTASLTGLKTKIIGPITPLGGLLLIASWFLLFYHLIVKKS